MRNARCRGERESRVKECSSSVVREAVFCLQRTRRRNLDLDYAARINLLRRVLSALGRSFRGVATFRSGELGLRSTDVPKFSNGPRSNSSDL